MRMPGPRDHPPREVGGADSQAVAWPLLTSQGGPRRQASVCRGRKEAGPEAPCWTRRPRAQPHGGPSAGVSEFCLSFRPPPWAEGAAQVSSPSPPHTAPCGACCRHPQSAEEETGSEVTWPVARSLVLVTRYFHSLPSGSRRA